MVEGNELLLASANVLTHRVDHARNRRPCCSDSVTKDGFGVAAGPELTRDRKLGV